MAEILPADVGPLEDAAAQLSGWPAGTFRALLILERTTDCLPWAAASSADPGEWRGMMYRLAAQLPEVRRSHG